MIRPGIYLLALLALLAPLPMGCVHCWSFYLLLVLVNIASLLLLRDEQEEKKDRCHYFLYGFLALGLFQLLPLPKFLLKLISPSAAKLLTRAGLQFKFHPLSLLPASSFLYLVGFSSFLLLGITLWKRKWTREEYLILVRAIILTGLVQSLFSILKFAGKSKKIFVVWGPHTIFPSGTLRNPDHLSALLEITLPVALGYLIYKIKRDGIGFFLRSWEFAILVSPIFILAGIFLSGSRAGLAATFLSLYAFAQILVQRISHTGYRRGYRQIFLLFLAVILVLGGLFTFKKGVPAVRHKIWALSLKAFFSYPIFGSGLGTFPDLIETYRKEPEFTALIEHAHNDYLEVLTETGIIGGFLLLYPLILIFYRTYKKWELRRYPLVKYLGAGFISSVIAVGFHSFFDFPLRVPAISLLFILTFSAASTIVHLRRRR